MPNKAVPFKLRIIAFLLDYVIISMYLLVLVGVSVLAKPVLAPLFTESPWKAEFTGFLFITLPVGLYFAICEGIKPHATWGKRKMRITVTCVHGQSVGLTRSLVRSAIKFLPWELAHFAVWRLVLPSDLPVAFVYIALAAAYGLAVVYLISPMWSKNRQTVYDLIAGTVVKHKNI